MGLSELGRFLMIAGSILFVLGVFFTLSEQFPTGRLLGDFVFRKGFVLPVTSCVLLSIIVTLVVNFYSK